MGPNFKVLLGLQIIPKWPFLRIIYMMIVVLIFAHNLHSVTGIPSEKNKGSRSRHALLQLIKQNQTNSNNTATVTTKTKASTIQDPLTKIFPSNIHAKKSNSTNVIEQSEDPEEILRKALINHTLANGGEGDLDQLIFSSIPRGSKLVVQTVKVMRTDENGNPMKDSETKEPVHWDVSLTNDTDIVDEYEDEDEDVDESPEEEKGRSASDQPKVHTDLAIAGSHSQANYKAYGASEKEKEKNKKYYHGNDHGKTHKVTHTDTDGDKVKNYKGKEKGLTDFDHAGGHSLNKENERFRDTKRKNKGRRVQGFKRVYHKEEFQRTEHFFDDEEAKRIAESYGLKDSKEQSNHGTKEDDRKYHGVRKEITDGKKLKNEHGTSNGYNKGQLTEYKDSEKHKMRSHYDKSQHSPRYNNHYQSQQQKQHHPNHNYHGSYSHPRNTIRRPSYSATDSNNDNNVLLTSADFVGSVAKAPMVAAFTVTPYKKDLSTDSSTDDPTILVPSPIDRRRPIQDTQSSTLQEPDEVRTFFSPRERPRAQSIEPDFKPEHTRGQRHHMHYLPKYRNTNFRPGFSRTPFRNKIGNASLADDELRRNYTNYYRNNNSNSYDNERYARNYPSSTVRNTLFGTASGPGSFSTLIKVMPVNYINLTDEYSGNDNDSRQQSINSNQIVSSPVSKYNSSNYLNTNAITFTTSVPYLIRRPPSRGNWLSINIGYPNRHPNHNYGGGNHASTGPLTNLVRGVKNKLMQPGLRPTYSTIPISHYGNRFDPSKYPPNVVQSNNVNSFATVPYSTASTQNVNQNSQLYQTAQPGVLKSYQTNYHNNNNNRNPAYSFNRPRTPHSLPPFMNNLMDSVANFFSRISNKESG